ncbi:HMCN [Lepeophtheirus salmonis]|uniref:HMCN n=1 Tax=Lepeophtheirus salmonis TaxID=72036 RepID=A0A7R8HEG5_LEPSM|nr:HMCN [Lepeophtheirus salmonis]CAF3041617.1 HMCN [Lepeophtheirus salmonis]
MLLNSVVIALGENDCIKQNIIVYNKYPYVHKYLKDTIDCQEYCFKDLHCYLFDYGIDTKFCRLFNVRVDKLSFRDRPNSVTGPKICDDTISVSIHSKGKEILISENYHREELTITKCRYLCLNDISCKAWTHFDDQCYLYSYPLYIDDLWEQGPNTPIFYGVNTKYIGVFHDYGEKQSLQNDACILDLHPEKSSRVGKVKLHVLKNYIIAVDAIAKVEKYYYFDLSRLMSFKCNGHTTCKIPESQNFEVELNYTCEPLQIKRFISDPQSFKNILDFGLRQLNITATDTNQNILSASYSTVGGSKTLDIFDKLKSISENDSRVYDEIKKGFEFIMHNFEEFNLSLSPRYPSFRFDHLDIGGIHCKDLLNISLCKFRYPREKGVQGLKSSFGECNEPFATRSTMKKFEDSQCTYQLPQLEWRTLMTGHSNSTLFQVKSSLKKELWRYLDSNGNYVFKIEIGISYINKDLQKTKFNLSLVWKQGNDIYGQRNGTKIFWNELFFFKGSKYWKAFTGLSLENEKKSFGEIFYLDDIGQYSDEEIVFTLYGNYYPNIDGNYSIHGWSDCTSQYQYRIMKCNNPSQAFNGRACTFPEPEKRACNYLRVGVWGSWESWSPCNESMKTRKRICDKPLLTAEDCIGLAFSSSECAIESTIQTTLKTSASIFTSILTSIPSSNTTMTKTETTTLNISSSVTPTMISSGDPVSTVTPTERTCTQYEPWSECSVSCGIGGIKRRILQCGSDLKIESEECSAEVCTEGKFG